MGEIYKITNNINGKCYVGKTKYNSVARWKDHVIGYHPNSAIHCAIAKYGVDNFTFEVIESNVDIDILDDMEIYYITLYNAKSPFGYNLTDGGEGGKGLVLTDEWRRKQSEAHKGIPWSERRRNAGYNHLKGNLHAKHHKVCMIDGCGNKLAIFDSISDASRATGITRTGIGRSCDGNRQTTAGGYHWIYLD